MGSGLEKRIETLETLVTTASEDSMNALHQAVAAYLLESFKTFRESGEPLDPKVMDQALKFLKDNDIKADPRRSQILQTLAEETPTTLIMPFEVSEEDEDVS